MKQIKFTRFKRITNKFLLSSVFVIILMLCCQYISKAKYTTLPKVKTEYVLKKTHITKIDTIQVKDSLKKELILEVSTYINRQTPKSNSFIPKYLVQAGLNNNIDICFMMAQTQIETNFGTLGAGRETSRRSMFGVANKKYQNYEQAVNHYCKILKKHYLTNGRTEQHLMSKYVTTRGGKYAQNPNYEKELKIAYAHIKKTTNIKSLQKKYISYM